MSDGSGFVRVVPSGELSAGEGVDSEIRDVRLGDETVLLGRLNDGRVVAFAASCPHELTDLRDATFVDGRVRCPRHNYMYDPQSGENVIPASVCRRENLWKLHPGFLPTYQVEERDGWVWVSATPNPPPASWDPALEERPPDAGRPGAETVSRAEPEPEPAQAPAAVEVPAKRLRVRVGREFELRLPLGAPAHTWTVEASAGLLAVVQQQLDPSPPPRQRVRIAAQAVGEGTLRCSFGLPWADPEEIRTYIVEVVSAS